MDVKTSFSLCGGSGKIRPRSQIERVLSYLDWQEIAKACAWLLSVWGHNASKQKLKQIQLPWGFVGPGRANSQCSPARTLRVEV